MPSNSPAAVLTAPSIAIAPRTPWWQRVPLDPAVILAVAGRCIGLVASLAGSIITARYLQPAGRGEYFFALTTAQLIAQFGNLGLQSGNTYFVARDRGLFRGLLANSFWVSFVAVPVIGLGLLLLSLTGSPGSLTSWFALALAPLFVFNLLGNGLLVGLDRMKAFSLMQPVSAAIVLPFLMVAATLHAGPNGFLSASLLAWTATIGIMLFLLFRQAGKVGPFRSDVFVTTFKYSTKAYLATLAGFVVLRLNVFVLHASAGAEQVGYYSVASQVADTLAILPQSIATVMFPRLVANEAGRLKATARDTVRTAGLMAAACTVVWLFADPAIQFAFGARFAPAAPVLRSMLPGVFLLGVISVLSQYLAASGFPVSVVVSWLGAVGLSAGLSGLLITRHGAVGAGETLSLTYGVLLIALLGVCWRTARTSRSA